MRPVRRPRLATRHVGAAPQNRTEISRLSTGRLDHIGHSGMEPPGGFEPPSPEYETGVLPAERQRPEGCGWLPWQDLNLHDRLNRAASYPLNDGATKSGTRSRIRTCGLRGISAAHAYLPCSAGRRW